MALLCFVLVFLVVDVIFCVCLFFKIFNWRISALQSLYIYIYPFPLATPSSPTHHPTPLGWKHKGWAGLPAWCSSSPLAVYFTQGGVDMPVVLSQFVPPKPNPALFLLLLRPSPLLLLFFQISSCLRTTSFFLKKWKTLLLVQKPKVINKGRERQQTTVQGNKLTCAAG